MGDLDNAKAEADAADFRDKTLARETSDQQGAHVDDATLVTPSPVPVDNSSDATPAIEPTLPPQR